MGRWNPKVFDNHIDREFSAFTYAEIPDPEPFSSGKHWMAHFFLSSTLNGGFSGCWHQLAMGLIWRAQLCLKHYSAARSETLEYVCDHDPSKPKFDTYFRALAEWEAFFVNAMLAIAFINKFIGKHTFSKADGSIYQRVYDTGTHIKHMQDKVAEGSVDHNSTMPIILTNDGIKASTGLLVSHAEMFKLLEELAAVVTQLKDPGKMAETRRAEKAVDKG